MYYSTEDVKHLLDSLRNSYETEVVEYKEAKSSFGDKDLGKYTGAQIVAEIGDIARFPNAKALVRYAGLDSSVNQSGQFDSGGGPITKHGSPYLGRAVWLAASRAWQYDERLGDFYRKKRSEGKPHRVAVTAVARKLCHVIFAVMRDQEAYDASR